MRERESENLKQNMEGPQSNPLMRVSRLDTLRHVRAEAGRLYREARRREGRNPDALTAQRLATILGAVQKSIEIQDIAERLEALEQRVSTDQSGKGAARA
jgi:hypothetical protein